MKKLKRIGSLILAVTLFITTVFVFDFKSVRADDEVNVKYVLNEQEFRDYIDADAKPIVDEITTEWEGYGNVHKITVPEDGTLLIAGMSNEGYAEIELYSNYALTAHIDTFKANNLITGNFGIYKVEKGSYYYRASRWNGYELPFYVYSVVGFIPKSGKVKPSGEFSNTQIAGTDVKVNEFNNENEFREFINKDGAYSSQDSIVEEWEGFSETHKFTLKHDGWLFVTNFEKDGYVNWSLYSNPDLSAKYLDFQASAKFDDKAIHKVYLKAGTYFYRASRWNGYEESINTTYLGFVSTENRIKVEKINKSKDNATATIVFSYDEKYLPNSSAGYIRLENGLVQTRKIADGEAWHTDSRENVVEGNSITVTANGTYTARIENFKDSCYGIVSFEVTGLKTAKPSPAKVTLAKKGTKTISGTAPAYVKVVVSVGGKTYSTKANGNGKWSVKVAKTLKKGDSISTKAVNSAGATSKVSKYKVK